MFGLTRDFVQQDGIRMVLGGQEGMPVSRLNTVQSRMLSSLSIPHHLRLFLKEMDLSVTLEYSVSGKKLLSHLLKGARLTLAEFYGLLLQIAQGMEDGRLHMLRPEQYALHTDYIFVEGALQKGKVYLTYVPLQSIESPQPLGESLKGLIMALMPSVLELNGDGVQRLLHYCGEDECTAWGWKELLSALLTENEGERQSLENEGIKKPGLSPETGIYPVERYFHEKNSNGAVPSFAVGPGGEPCLRNSPRMNGSSPDRPGEGSVNLPEALGDTAHSPFAEWMGGGSIFQKQRKDEDAAEPDKMFSTDRFPNSRSSPMRTYILLGCILLDALIWKYLYLDRPGRAMLIICGIVTITLLVICGLAWMGRIGRTRMEGSEIGKEQAEEADFPGFRAPLGFKPARSPDGQDKFGALPSSYPPPVERGKRIVAGISEFGIGEQGMKQAEEYQYPKEAESGLATVLLPREKAPPYEEAQPSGGTLPYLARTEEGSNEREVIELNRTSFIIGRSPEVAQHVETSEGTSRVHAEVFRSGGLYVLKDLDSRNGTRLQGEAMIPYKEYPLADGDVFTIIKGNYTFHQR